MGPWLQELRDREVLILLVILEILFGAVKLPKLARSLGQSRNEFKRGLSDEPELDDRCAGVSLTVGLGGLARGSECSLGGTRG